MSDLKVLIIDDDKIITFLIKAMVQKFFPCKTVYEFVNGKEALDFLKDNPNGKYLLLLDLNMPVMGGREFLKNIENDAHLKEVISTVIVTSSIDEEDKKIQDQYKHIIDYFEKPVSRERLMKLIEHPRLN